MRTTTPSRPQSAASSVRITDPLSLVRLEMGNWLSNVLGSNGDGVLSGTFIPELDITEKDNCFELRMDIPGMESKDLDIQVQGNTVTISGQRKEEKEEKGRTVHRVERRSGSFSRTVTLPCPVTEKEVAAEYTNGVLSVVLPKSEEARPKKISIKG